MSTTNYLAENIARYAKTVIGKALCDMPGAQNIVYVEGMDLSGEVNRDEPDKWNDCRFVVSFVDGAWQFTHQAKATTEPGVYYTKNPLNKYGAARIAFGYHPPCCRAGLHKGKQPALVQSGPIRVIRDANRDGKRNPGEKEVMLDNIGLNHHTTAKGFFGDTVGRYSAGCLVGQRYAQHLKFLEVMATDSRRLASEAIGQAYDHDFWVLDGSKLAHWVATGEQL